jgi:hypothetical protein
MKVHRVILCIDHPDRASVLRLVLQTNGYRVQAADDVGEIPTWEGIDLAVIGYRMKLDEGEIPVGLPSLRLRPDMGVQQMLERIRILLVRKRGPKKKAG